MADKKLYAIGTFKYQHRMLTAGDSVTMNGPDARLYEHLKLVSETKPRVARAPVAAESIAGEPAKPKARRKRRAKK